MNYYTREDWFYVRLLGLFRYYHPSDVRRGPLGYQFFRRLNLFAYKFNKTTERWLKAL